MAGRSLLAAAGLLVLGGLPAMGQERPAYVPTRDVTVDYATVGDNAAKMKTMRMYTAANGAKMRIEGPGMPGYLIMDRTDNQTVMVMTTQHMFMQIPSDPGRTDRFMLNDSMKFSRKGTDTVAGLSCTNWKVQRDATHGGTACITADGVLLRGESPAANGGMDGLTATAVKYGALPASIFLPPPDFKKFQMPNGMPPPGMPPR